MQPQFRKLLLLAASFAVVACNDNGPTEIPGLDVVSVELTPASHTIAVGDSLVLNAYPKNEDGVVLGGRQIIWSSADTAVARVSPRVESAVIRARAPGTVEITANVEGRAGKATVTIVAAEPAIATLQIVGGADTTRIGNQHRYDAIARAADGSVISGRTITWQISEPELMTLDGPADGSYVVGLARAAGGFVLIASVDGIYAHRMVMVRSSPIVPVSTVRIVGNGVVSIYSDEQHQLTVRTYAADGTELFGRGVSWTITNSAIASVDQNGRVVARAVGSADVTAAVEGQTSTVAIDVRSRIVRVGVFPGMVVLGAGEHQDITATLYDANNGVLQRPIVWTSSNEAIATVDANGTVRAHSPGTAIIKPTSEGQEGWVDVRVVEWVKWNLQAVRDSALPSTLYVRTNAGVTPMRVIARQGDLRMILVGANSGRFQLHFDVSFDDGTHGQMIFGGNYFYDAQNTMVFQTYGGRTLTGRRFTDGRIVITGMLDANTSEVTLTYRQP